MQPDLMQYLRVKFRDIKLLMGRWAVGDIILSFSVCGKNRPFKRDPDQVIFV